MVEEIILEFRPHRGLKILSPANGKIINSLPAIESHISFRPFVNFLKDKFESTSVTRANFYKYLIRKFEDQPNLLQSIGDFQQLENHEDLIEFLSTAIFPVVSAENDNVYTLSVPYTFDIFSYSEPFRHLFIDQKEEHLQLPEEISAEYLRDVQCSMIYSHVLEKYYGIKLNENPELVIPVVDSITGMKRYYRMRYDHRFIDLKVKGGLPPIQDCAVCLNTFRILNLEQQLKTMPLDLFEAEGFAVWVAEDITVAKSTDQIKKILLTSNECDIENVEVLKNAIHALIGLNDIQIGLMPFVEINNTFLLNEDCTSHSLIGKHWHANDAQSNRAFHDFIKFQKANPEPMPITNLNESLFDFAPFLKPLHQQGIRSYIYYPMQNNEGLLGMLELASNIPNLLTQQVMATLEPAIPLISLAMLKNKNAFKNRIEKLVKEKFTALQPSVEWKFSEVAWTYLQNKEPTAETSEIFFENVFPLYGAVDIRNSSNERNTAIQKDLTEHLRLIDSTLDQLQVHVPMTFLEELRFKNQKFQQAIEDIVFPEDEVRLNDFLFNEVEPVFTHLQKNNLDVESIIAAYFKIEKNSNGPIFHYRNEFEETLGLINHTISQYFEEQEDALQKSYPHYFEKYRTDGVEYNIYIGQSMAPGKIFDQLYLKNIRLWQLQSMAEIGKITHRLLPKFKIPLETTQLILIYNKPVSIYFRKDERRFDVEGSYNIRYEVMKKRIVKALIKNTNERLTQPGKIAMVYSSQKEAQEYEEYIYFIQSKGLLMKEIESLDLEDLQGLKGLKALRVTVNLE